MGFLDIFKSKAKKEQLTYVKMLDNNSPIFSQFGNDIFASDVVQQALWTIASEFSKLNPKHIREQNFDVTPVDGAIQNVFDNPNFLMTTSEFLEKAMFNLMLNYNSFIYIENDSKGNLAGLHPLSPTNVTFCEDSKGDLFIEFLFKSGYKTILPYSKIIHWKSHYSSNDLMGGNEQGQPDHQPLLNTLRLNEILLQGVKKALQSSFAINGIVKYNTMLDDGTMKHAIADFETKLKTSDSGILGIDNKADVVQFKRELQVVDESTLKFIDDKILRNFGVPVEIIRGNFTAEQYEAFYQKTIEPYVISFSQAVTKKLFTNREIGFNNKIKLYPKELVFMNTAQTLAMVNLLGQSGTLYENEKRVAFGYPPLPELNGVRLQSLNYVDVNIARDYQMKNNSKSNDTPAGNSDTNNSDELQGGGVIAEVIDEAQDIVKKPLLVGQIQALSDIVAGFQSGTYTYNQAKQMLVIGVGLTEEEAKQVLDIEKDI